MQKIFKSGRRRRFFMTACVIAVALVLVACAPETKDEANTDSSGTAALPAANEFGVITSESWKDLYPHEYATYGTNSENYGEGSDLFVPRGDMIEMYPQIKIIWEGNGFSKSYFEPNGHQYAIDDISASGRPNEKTLANCLTCKSADFTAMYQQQGDAIFSQPYAQILEEIQEPISCYNCHENDPESLAVTQAFFVDALGSDASNVPESAQVCGQCHNEYFFNAETKAVTNPYSSLETMTPEAIYQYYQTAGFKDATHPSSGVDWVKVQHSEFEFVYSGEGSSMSQRTNPATGERYSCADCHMGNEVEADDGTSYRSHLLISPLENEELLTSCNIKGCHTDLASQVKGWQAESEGKVQNVADKLAELTTQIATQKDSLDPTVLEQVKALDRESQFYWEFVMVENSEGAHNPQLSNSCLDRASILADEALVMLA